MATSKSITNRKGSGTEITQDNGVKFTVITTPSQEYIDTYNARPKDPTPQEDLKRRLREVGVNVP